MSFFRCCCFLLVLFSSLGLAEEECVSPESPAIPQGRSTNRDTMVESRLAVKNFVAASTAYRDCLQAKLDTAGEAIDPAYKAILMDQIDSSVETELLVVDMFNTQLRLFKAQNEEL